MLVKCGIPCDRNTTINCTVSKRKVKSFVLSLKGICGLSTAKAKLGLDPLEEPWKIFRTKLLMKVLSNDEVNHSLLISTFDDIISFSTLK